MNWTAQETLRVIMYWLQTQHWREEEIGFDPHIASGYEMALRDFEIYIKHLLDQFKEK